MKVVAIIQARLGSTRLPNKVLMKLGGKTVLEQVARRAAAIPGVSEVIVASPKGPKDAALRDLGKKLPVTLFAGSEEDVLDRFYQAAKASSADVVLRVTADCPLLDPEIGGRVLKALIHNKADYATNTLPQTFPDGLDVEAFRFKALETAWRRAASRLEREHVTPYLRNHPARFKQALVTNDRDLSRMRWTLDEPADLKFLKAVYQKLPVNGSFPSYKKIVALLEKNPELSRLNGSIRPNEGYYLSMLKESPIPAKPLRLKRSLELLKKSQKLIPGSSQTFSKAPNQFVKGVAPLFLKRGKGCLVWDVDGNEFIDTTMGLAPVSLGYADPDVNAAVAAQLPQGTLLSQPHPLESEVAQLLSQCVPSAEMTRFAKSGSDATSGAVRLARAYTGRELIAAGGYHGWHDWFIGTTTRARGVPEATKKLTLAFQYNKIESLHKIFKDRPGQVAAVILEPIGVEEPRDNFLENVAELTRKNGALLIFDEVVTGFRLGLGGAQGYFGVTPDISCFGKSIANGFPLSAVTGPAKIMRLFEEIFFSFTFGGELLSLAAAKAAITKMRRKPVFQHLWQEGRRLKDGYNTLSEAAGLAAHSSCIGLEPHSVITFKNARGNDWWELKSLMQQECVRRGFLFMGLHNPSYAHSAADVDRILKIYASTLPIIAEAVRKGTVDKKLQGPPVQPIFRRH